MNLCHKCIENVLSYYKLIMNTLEKYYHYGNKCYLSTILFIEVFTFDTFDNFLSSIGITLAKSKRDRL